MTVTAECSRAERVLEVDGLYVIISIIGDVDDEIIRLNVLSKVM